MRHFAKCAKLAGKASLNTHPSRILPDSTLVLQRFVERKSLPPIDENLKILSREYNLACPGV